VIGMLHAFPMEEEPEATDEPMNPVLEPYAMLEVSGSYYVSAVAVFPEHRDEGLGTRMLEMAKEQARLSGRKQVSLQVFERNEGAVELYRRNGFEVISRAPVRTHQAIRYTGEVLLMTATAE
jgi:ribosomal protein S18 acetylase RimI-like enzyme